MDRRRQRQSDQLPFRADRQNRAQPSEPPVPEGVFPFAYPVLTDHLSGRTGGRSARCTASNTCPKAFDGNSSNEYWVKAGSLLHTDTRGNDLPDPENVRFFLISGLSHGVGNVNSMGTCQQFLNPTSPFPALRALLVALMISGSPTAPSRRKAGFRVAQTAHGAGGDPSRPSNRCRASGGPEARRRSDVPEGSPPAPSCCGRRGIRLWRLGPRATLIECHQQRTQRRKWTGRVRNC